METKRFNSANEIIDYLRLNNPHWDSQPISLHGTNWIFRGQEDASWELIPSAHRDYGINTLKNFVSNYYPVKNIYQMTVFDIVSYYGFTGSRQWITESAEGVTRKVREYIQKLENGEYIFSHAQIELAVVKNFIDLADRIGISTPISDTVEMSIKRFYDHINSYEGNGLPDDLKKVIEDFPTIELREAFALAQHHGIPTRLLDWSFSPLVALYFAVEKVWENGIKIKDYANKKVIKVIDKWDEKVEYWTKAPLSLGNQIVVWALDSQQESGLEKIITPYARNSFLKAQSGMFTYCKDAGQYFIDHRRWPSQDEIINKYFDEHDKIPGTSPKYTIGHKFKKLTISKIHARDILLSLHNENITSAHIMPTLDNVRQSYANFTRLLKNN